MPLNVTTPEMTSEVTCNDSWAECARWRMWLWRRCRPWFRWAGLVGRANGYILLCAGVPVALIASRVCSGSAVDYEGLLWVGIVLLVGYVETCRGIIRFREGWERHEVNIEGLVAIIFAGGSTLFSLIVLWLYWRYAL